MVVTLNFMLDNFKINLFGLREWGCISRIGPSRRGTKRLPRTPRALVFRWDAYTQLFIYLY
ncbi:MAG: hypothetical protein EWV91_03180 [Microcystis aeruginosa Ma_QC_Ca_00000000_S207]|uniref:Uncharacterized protein n=1 Tax=Microcystis aeruginosa Ma_QC_Ca_00000000_S207 TaxID=2486251 RepID=A0A552G153_MICAE|nr:MAG: hypothetical protein EWV84_11165 [Microcystis sp. M_QC_C_20170808_M3Col]TRU52698.1 MAG: hypothetical protein EWV91_03180 [Microcystis aeruginosa Ma_QC_Ca_00000000_S207]